MKRVTALTLLGSAGLLGHLVPKREGRSDVRVALSEHEHVSITTRSPGTYVL